MPVQITPVDRDASEQQVLERILSTLDIVGPMQLDDLVIKLQLYSHPSTERILKSAVGDGLIEVDPKSNIVRIRPLGRDVGQTIRAGSKMSS